MTRLLAAIFILSSAHASDTVPLAGEWRFALDPADKITQAGPKEWDFPETIKLPGILTAQGFGDVPNINTRWTGKGWEPRELFPEWQTEENFKMPFFLTPPRHYLGAAWYQREVKIPADWKGQDIRVFLERVHWQSTLWINGVESGSANSLGTPHEIIVKPLSPGKHTLTLRIDNRLSPINPGRLAHSVTDHTQGNWNGIIGEMRLEALPASRVDSLWIDPSNDGTVRVVVSGFAKEAGEIQLSASDGGAERFPMATKTAVKPEEFSVTIEGRFQKMPIRLWSEFQQPLYRLTATLGGHTLTETFGFREAENRDGILTINGTSAFMRGTLECAIFPRLGHPPTDVGAWRRIIRICKDHGLNHIRFHSWCPPEAAFIAADELGMYFQVEASSWANGESQIGSGRPVDSWVDAETDRILAAYGNHPSFVFMTYGNEPGGPNHKQWLSDWVKRQQEKDPRHLYTTAAGWPIRKGSDFHSTSQPRIQRWGEGLGSIINSRPPATDFNWSNFTRRYPDTPVIAHEIGQWCAYPNYDEIEKYDGYFKAKNFEIFQETTKRNGLIGQAHDFLIASGKWQTAAYKHDIEAALRTPDFGGFQLLDLHDFPGQGTALVGVLDAFWDSKGYITADEFSRFCSPVVPLAVMKKLVFTTDETLEADLQLSHFGPSELKDFEPAWILKHDDTIVAAGNLDKRNLKNGALHSLGKISVPLGESPAPARLVLTVGGTDTGIFNSWDIFVFPKEQPESPATGFVTTRTIGETLAALDDGKAVLWLANPSKVTDDPDFPLTIGFSPIFWNTAYTEWQPPHTLGLLNRAEHPALADFPTQTHSNWQWWEIIKRSRPFILTPHHTLKPIIQPIDDWVTNRKLALVFEAKVGEGRLLACSADLSGNLAQRPSARQLRVSLERYAASDRFKPGISMTPDDLKKLVVKPRRVELLGAKATSSSEAPGFEASKAIDGNPATLWHTPYAKIKPPLPHDLTLTFPDAVKTDGLVLTARTDNINGRPSKITVLDENGTVITNAEIPVSAGQMVVNFPKRVSTKTITIRVDESHTPPFASIAEVDLLP